MSYLPPSLRAKLKLRGLGDVVYLVARPVVKAADAVLRTDLQNCGGCKGRRETLNQKFPL
ncbi:MAG: hypothetical protein KGL39_02915 [Patescibacteria group bacterium]|nr:hypothetical protein [Patescibacteria group bacterium]